ncbi:MAG: hypothetical protein WA809_06520, partial [Candidatus Dormiibacterota bacterium]
MALPTKPVTSRRRTSPPRSSQGHEVTLSVDVGGTGIKAELLDPAGKPLKDSVRVKTEYPLAPTGMLQVFKKLADASPGFT